MSRFTRPVFRSGEWFSMSERNQVRPVKVEVNLGGIARANPFTVASGTFGYGREYEHMSSGDWGP